jgi:hypothetical protein
MPTDEESGDSYRNTKVGDLRLDELLEISIPHANGFAVGSAIEEDLRIRCQARVDDHRLFVERPQRRHRSHLAVRIERPKFSFACQSHQRGAARFAKPIEIDETIRRQHGERRLVVDYADDGLGPLAAGHVCCGSLLLCCEGNRMLYHGEVHTMLFEIAGDRGRNHKAPPLAWTLRLRDTRVNFVAGAPRDTVDAKRQALTARIRALDEEHGRYVAAIVIAAQWRLLAHLLGPITITEDLGRC